MTHQIFVKSLNGRTFACNVNYTDSVESVKKQIQDKEGITPEN